MKSNPNKACFLDRDGVVNVYGEYIGTREDFHFQEGIFELCRAASDSGFLLIVATNQAGIARGLFTEQQFLELTDWMLSEFRKRGVEIARVYYCPYHAVHGIGKYKYDSPDRKPNPGMLLRAQADYHLDLKSSILIGDSLSDIQAAQSAGVGTPILLRSRAEQVQVDNTILAADSLQEIRIKVFGNDELKHSLKPGWRESSSPIKSVLQFDSES